MDESRIVRELGKTELQNMYIKIDKIYEEKWNMSKKSDANDFMEENVRIYSGNIEYQYIIGASIGMKKNFHWLKEYILVWKVYDSEDDMVEDLKEGLLEAQ